MGNVNQKIKTKKIREWKESTTPISRRNLIKQRQNFWSTRIDGNSDNWNILKMEISSEKLETKRRIHSESDLSPLKIDIENHCYKCNDANGYIYT
ncbi:hypothetical protein MHBO_002699 [Bonamia ostreae]|uniref:DC-UbP/UBTD2 N-terminal domain-containing protein n=1 Tax=Bonamia ostreae TaxID=126728 RepID=A0ABV2AN87_9EUKA